MQLLPNSKRSLAVYLINMDGATDRLAAMTEKMQAAGLTSVERVAGVDGRKLDYPIREFSDLSYKLLHGRRRTPPEIGCYLSHVVCARKFLESGADFALILEDDVAFKEDFIQTLDAAAGHPGDWDLLRLTTVSSGKKFHFRPLNGERALAVALTREKGSGAYLINRKAGSWITRKLVPMRLAYDIAFDLEFLAGLKSTFVDPLPADQDTGYESQIQNDLRRYRLPRWRYFTVLPYRIYLETSRVLLRGLRLLGYKLGLA